ncbi:putative membrane protein [Photorhabdus asymbiotica]|uniref:Membrane protein n=3 Tax=Morganellaceae TaxID=1903414 RepID=C7BTI5_PHOAA|nr:putative membrane protein [Photorhabdus asymbiotica]CAQ83840.1 putative membrane protein [Photorhabdus asymbiotica]
MGMNVKAGIEQHKATVYGILAIVLWSTIVGLIRSISESFGPVGGAALIYTVGSIFLVLLIGLPKISVFPKAYLWLGSLLFVSYEICLSLALGFADNRVQAIELGMVNYLWPGFTVLLSVMVNKQKVNWWLYPGLLLSVLGIGWVMSGDNGWSFRQMIENIQSNPLSYGLAFAGAIIWAMYCNITKIMSEGKNGMSLFFILTALALWIQYFFTSPPEMVVTLRSVSMLLFAGAVIGVANAAWTVAIIRGYVTLLATLSYFTPIISTAFSSLLLSTALSFSFWQGVLMVTVGSIICWLATRTK